MTADRAGGTKFKLRANVELFFVHSWRRGLVLQSGLVRRHEFTRIVDDLSGYIARDDLIRGFCSPSNQRQGLAASARPLRSSNWPEISSRRHGHDS